MAQPGAEGNGGEPYADPSAPAAPAPSRADGDVTVDAGADADAALDAFCSWRAIWSVALPAFIMNAASPLAVVSQTALIGRYGGTASLAAYSSVSIVVGFGTRVFNFLVDGVSAKVGKSVGARRWDELGARVRLALGFALAAGAVAAAVLAAVQRPLTERVLRLEDDVLRAAELYWPLRIATVPPLLLSMAASGCLQGFKRVRAAAAINSCQALAELAGSAVVLVGLGASGRRGLFGVGLVGLVTQAAAAAAGAAAVVLLPPADAGGRYSLRAELFGRRRGRLRRPLLEAEAEVSAPARPGAVSAEHLLDFVADGANMLVRSVAIQASFLLALVAAARLGTAALAAHSVIAQLWMLVSYAIDGFAAAGVVLGSRLAGASARAHSARAARAALLRLVRRVSAAGLAGGLVAGVVYAAARLPVARAFTREPDVLRHLAGPAWWVLAAAQPVNGLAFVYDSLMYSSQAFGYIRNLYVLGLALVFAPLLAAQAYLWPSLAGVWAAKAGMNVWRLCGAAWLVFGRFLAEFEAEYEEGAAAAAAAAAAPAV